MVATGLVNSFPLPWGCGRAYRKDGKSDIPERLSPL